ncbi:MAG: hypothetical protein PVH61_29545 [Candidatus Aminicenantes bacterium]|jgi:hypothetical protein
MPKLPKVICSSVIRSAHKGESHGGVYIVDLETEQFEQVVDWNDQSINWEGRGLDRGLRGIDFYDGKLYMAASDEIFVYDKNFKIIESYKNNYLKHCHEIFIGDNRLFISSTGFDSILVFDMAAKSFIKGYCLRRNVSNNKNKLSFESFDPNAKDGPLPGDTIHLNNVFYDKGKMFFASIKEQNLFYIKTNNDKLCTYAKIPPHTHNARPYGNGVLINDTANNQVAYLSLDGQIIESFPILLYPEKKLKMNNLPEDHARQAFGRGLCVTDDDLIIGGSSPATISVYRLGHAKVLKTINITMDIRNSIHGLEIWPL